MGRAAFDVVIAGGGPAGAVAALVLCRAGARVAIFDRARFPRHKLCGDTVNPGTLAILQRLGVAEAAGAHAISGMVVTGAHGVRIEGRYPKGITGRAVLRRDFDHALLMAASAAGARIEEDALVRGPASTDGSIDGLLVSSRAGAAHRVQGRVVIAADGRHSRVARSLHLAWHPPAPRRWAVGAYFQDVCGLTACGEMHIRQDQYIGVAPLPGALTNACVVTGERAALRNPPQLLLTTLRAEPALRERFADARLADRPVVLGPLAVDCIRGGVPGLLLAGDAAGFIDPMTGDGLHFAIRGAELAAIEALRALEKGPLEAHSRLLAARRREFGAKWRFNRAMRALAGSPRAVRVAGALAAWVPAGVERAILYAGDVRAPLPT
jgi:flavin-dependent dehydrogenase